MSKQRDEYSLFEELTDAIPADEPDPHVLFTIGMIASFTLLRLPPHERRLLADLFCSNLQASVAGEEERIVLH